MFIVYYNPPKWVEYFFLYILQLIMHQQSLTVLLYLVEHLILILDKQSKMAN